MIRIARTEDAFRLAEIFAPYVTDTAISFSTEIPTEKSFLKKINEILPAFPFLVHEHEGLIVAYAYAAPHRSLSAYRWCTEVSVYADTNFQRGGSGTLLYSALLKILKLQGLYNAYAGITLPNEASVGLHEKLGFRPFAVYKSIGFKAGAWRDVGWWELRLQEERESAPAEPLPFAALREHESAVLASIFGS